MSLLTENCKVWHYMWTHFSKFCQCSGGQIASIYMNSTSNPYAAQMILYTTLATCCSSQCTQVPACILYPAIMYWTVLGAPLRLGSCHLWETPTSMQLVGFLDVRHFLHQPMIHVSYPHQRVPKALFGHLISGPMFRMYLWMSNFSSSAVALTLINPYLSSF